MNTLSPSLSVREQLAQSTHTAHRVLHRHPWIARLTRSNLSVRDYNVIVQSYRVFFEHVEHARLQLKQWSHVGLEHAVIQLRHDTHHQVLSGFKAVNLPLGNAVSVLGALYVLHGARFGARMIDRCLQKSVPECSKEFFTHPPPDAQWQALLDCWSLLIHSSLSCCVMRLIRRLLRLGSMYRSIARGLRVLLTCMSQSNQVVSSSE